MAARRTGGILLICVGAWGALYFGRISLAGMNDPAWFALGSAWIVEATWTLAMLSLGVIYLGVHLFRR